MKKRLEYLTRVYFEAEMKKLAAKQRANPNNYAFYTEVDKDEKTRSYRTTLTLKEEEKEGQATIESPEQRQFMIRPTNLEYFYEEKETSESVYLYHQRLNAAWRIATYLFAAGACWAMYKTYEQHRDIYEAAGTVVKPKTSAKGAATRAKDDGSIEVLVDGRVVDVITESNIGDEKNSADLQTTLRQALAYMVAAKT